MKRVLFAGGGTGGHIYPALAIRETLIEKLGNNLVTAYAGQLDGMEAGIVGRIDGLPFLPIRAQGMPRTLSMKWLSFPFRNILGFWDAMGQIKAFSPDLVIATGGYVAFPTLMAARWRGCPFVIHEQNAAIGVTNRLFTGSAAKILLTYGETFQKPDSRVVVTGNPVRKAFLSPSAASGRFNKKDGESWILVVGGSRGARSLNESVIDLGKSWLPSHPKMNVLHVAGERDYAMVKERVGENPRHQVVPYLHDIREAFDLADLLVSRAGATILAEIAVCGKPAILVPFPHATDNHQEKNAKTLAARGAAMLLLDSDLNKKSLAVCIEGILAPETLKKMGEAMRGSRPPNVEESIWTALQPLLA